MLCAMRAQLFQTLTAGLDSPRRGPQFVGGGRKVGKTTFVKERARRARSEARPGERTCSRAGLCVRPYKHQSTGGARSVGP